MGDRRLREAGRAAHSSVLARVLNSCAHLKHVARATYRSDSDAVSSNLPDPGAQFLEEVI